MLRGKAEIKVKKNKKQPKWVPEDCLSPGTDALQFSESLFVHLRTFVFSTCDISGSSPPSDVKRNAEKHTEREPATCSGAFGS